MPSNRLKVKFHLFHIRTEQNLQTFKFLTVHQPKKRTSFAKACTKL